MYVNSVQLWCHTEFWSTKIILLRFFTRKLKSSTACQLFNRTTQYFMTMENFVYSRNAFCPVNHKTFLTHCPKSSNQEDYILDTVFWLDVSCILHVCLSQLNKFMLGLTDTCSMQLGSPKFYDRKDWYQQILCMGLSCHR
jgi:hypothetical protein